MLCAKKTTSTPQFLNCPDNSSILAAYQNESSLVPTRSLLNQTLERQKLGISIFNKYLGHRYPQIVEGRSQSTGLGDDETPEPPLLWVCSLSWVSQRHLSTPDLIASQNEIESHHRDFPGGPVVKNVPSNAGDTSLIPVQGSKIPYTEGPLSLSATTERSLTLAQQKIPCAVTQTQCSQINNK